MAKLYNRVGFQTITSGIGSIAVGPAINSGLLTPADAGAQDGDSHIPYLIEELGDFEIGYGTYNSAGPTFDRDTVIVSKIASLSGTAKMVLDGSAEIRFVADADTLAVATVVDEFVGDGVLVDFAMSVTPATDADLQVFIDGVHQHPDEWSFSGGTLTFTEAPANSAKIVARIGNQAGPAAVPADGSVTAAKIAGSSVGTSALANGAATPDKRAHQFFIAREQYDVVTNLAAVAGDNVRVLNTKAHDDFGTVALSVNGQITGLPAGRYRVSGYCSKYAANHVHQAFLYNVTDASIVIPGHAGYAGTSSGTDSVSIPVSGIIDISSGKTFELRQWSSGAYANGLGYATGKRTDLDIVYSEITFERIGV